MLHELFQQRRSYIMHENIRMHLNYDEETFIWKTIEEILA